MSLDSIKVLKGQKFSRVDGALKVCGQAQYTADQTYPNLAHAVLLRATIGKGRIKKLDDSRARKQPGVLGVYSYLRRGPLYRSTPEEGFTSRIDEARPAFEDEIIRYYGQYVAMVVAETLEIAQDSCRQIDVTYVSETPELNSNLGLEDEIKMEHERGQAEKIFSESKIQINQTYITPQEVHNPIEMHATLAHWDSDDQLTVYESSQAILNHQNVLAQMLGHPKEKVRVISKFLGSGFGGKLWPWSHSMLTALAARELKRPVKLVVDRSMMFTNVGHRPRTQQVIKLSSTPEGKLTSLQHRYASEVSLLDHYRENCGESTGFLYECANVKITSALARRNVPTPTSMRGPGAVPGLFALESALDELAWSLKMDPLELRLKNDTQVDGSTGHPFSSRHLKECLQLGAEQFGWDRFRSQVGSLREGAELIGLGLSSCTWSARSLDCDALVEFKDSGRVKISTATQDIGTGTYTVLAQVLNRETGIPLDLIDVELGDTRLPPGPLSGGSMATASVIPAAVSAARAAIKNLLKSASENPFSPFHGTKATDLNFQKGRVHKPGSSGYSLSELLPKMNMHSVTGRAHTAGSSSHPSAKTIKSFGAQFVEIGFQPETARLRVRRVVSVIDGGHIVNYQQAKNQIEGAVIMGIGMGLLEEVHLDHRDGFTTNDNLADYLVATHADSPPALEVHFLDYPDKELNEYGARGVGEIGLAGIASAICSAVYHATGIRVRELPIKIEDLLKA